MKQPQATIIKKQLSEAFIARPKNLVRSFGVLEGVNSAAISASIPLITGVGLGQLSPDEYYVRLLASSPISGLDAVQILKTFNLSAEEVKIVTVGRIQFQNQPIRDRRRPASPGASIGHHAVTAGTLGCLVHKGGQVYILSNNHVLANTNRAAIGDPILQPGPTDGGSIRNDAIGHLSHFVPLDLNGANQLDAALALPDNAADVTKTIPLLGDITGITPARTGMKVAKYGRTTGLTFGEIISRDTDIRVDFTGGIINFENQLEIISQDGTFFSQPGDSGAIIVEVDTLRAVGLLFAGAQAGSTFANPIANVLQAFDVDIL